MREIKFRAWDSEKECWCSNLVTGNILYEIHANKHHDLNDTFVLQQFTGLKDKNGKDIYEGDVLCWPEFEGKKHQSRWIVEWDAEKAEYIKWHPKNKAEVIGNIYQNPELVKH